MLGLPTSSGWALVAAGRIPQPIKIGRRTRWSQRLLQTWIAEQSEAAQRQSPNRA
jgi:predicted DNA-binding transcriptional regulator AlpA